MGSRETPSERVSEVWQCLERVCDPELDESVVDLGFIEKLEVTADDMVEVVFRLPTYWCSPNFVFLMADGIRSEVETLPWATGVAVRVQDHLFADQVNDGVNSGRSFTAIFEELADGEDLGKLRRKFEEKAFQRRQEAVLLQLQVQGLDDDAIVALRLEQLDALELSGEEARAQWPRYRQLLVAKGLAASGGDLAFRSYAGEPLTTAGLKAYLGRLRAVRINMEFNGALCRGLQRTRYKEVDPNLEEPTLVDFIRDRVPSCRRADEQAHTRSKAAPAPARSTRTPAAAGSTKA